MLINRIAIKRNSQELIRTSRPRIIYAGCIILLLGIITSILSQSMVGINMSETELDRYFQYVEDGNFEFALQMLESASPSVPAVIINIALEIISYIMGAGFIIFLLNSIRKAGACYGNLLDGFGMFLRIIWLGILQYFFIFLWSLLLVVPGIIAAYRYRMAIYLLLDHPEMSAMACIRESKRMMTGHKAELFTFDLSFIGWHLLGILPFLGYLVQVWTLPYMSTCFAMYYEALKNMPQVQPNPAGGYNNYGNPGTPPPWEG